MPGIAEFIRAIATVEPESLRELSRFLDRDVKNVLMAVNRLEELGLVDLEETGRAKKPTVWYDRIEIDVQVGPTNDDESAIPPA